MRVVATAGHVDHGKSTLLRRLTGMEPDRWEEERQRGLTIDLGFVWASLDGPDGPMTVAFVDVPGHQRFVANMLSGAGAIEYALLVVAADDGWSAQTAEHVAILDLLGVGGVVTVVTKASLVSQARLAEVVADVSRRLAGTSLGTAPVMAVDSLTGDGLDELAQTLTTRLASLPAPADTGARRLWIDRVFTIAGAGTVVTGTLQGGTLTVGQEVQHVPSGRLLRIRGLHALGQPVEQAPAGTRVAVNLARVAVDELDRGDALVADDWLTTDTIDTLLRSVADEPVQARGAWHLHIGSAEVPVQLQPLLDQIGPGESGPVRLQLARSLPLRLGDRFVLRSVGTQTTAAGGTVLDPRPAPRAKGMLARLELAERLDTLHQAGDPAVQLERLLELHHGHLPEQRARASLASSDLPASPNVTRLGSSVVLAPTLHQWQQTALDAVHDWPPDRGAYLTEVTAALDHVDCPGPLRRAVIDRLCDDGRLQAHGDILTTPQDTATYLAALARRQGAVLDAMATTALAPPDLDQLTREHQLVGTELQALFDDRRLIQLDAVAFTATAIVHARQILVDTFGDRAFSASEAREAWQTTRKFAVPLLEHLARTGTTTFDGTHHHLTPTNTGHTSDVDPNRNTDG